MRINRNLSLVSVIVAVLCFLASLILYKYAGARAADYWRSILIGGAGQQPGFRVHQYYIVLEYSQCTFFQSECTDNENVYLFYIQTAVC